MLNCSFKIANRIYHTAIGIFVLGAMLALPACAVNTGDEGTQDEETATTEQALTGWTFYTSDELEPISCGGTLVNGVQCRGAYCDDIRYYCLQTPGVRTDSYWTPQFSEEGSSTGKNRGFCNEGYWVSGIACEHDNCDNVSLECSQMANVSAHDCNWTGWHSEESGGQLWFGTGYYARGAECRGSKCDDMRYYVCQL